MRFEPQLTTDPHESQSPSPLYSGERAGVRGFSSVAVKAIANTTTASEASDHSLSPWERAGVRAIGKPKAVDARSRPHPNPLPGGEGARQENSSPELVSHRRDVFHDCRKPRHPNET